MTAVTDPQIARDRHNNVSIGAQNGNVAPNMDIVLHSGVPCAEFFQIWILVQNEVLFIIIGCLAALKLPWIDSLMVLNSVRAIHAKTRQNLFDLPI